MELKYKSWNDITINVFQKLKDIQIQNTDDKLIDNINNNISLLSVLCDVDEDEIADLTASEFNRLLEQTSFLNDMPKKNISNSYIINGKKYDVFVEMRDMTMAQYIDYQTLIKDKEKNFKQLLAIFLLPHGKKYCDGYNITEVIEDIGEMNIVDANGLLFFFVLLFRSLTKSMLTYSIRQMKKMMRKEKDREMKMKIGRAIVEMQRAVNLVKNGDGFIG